jgi:hypothetical protein
MTGPSRLTEPRRPSSRKEPRYVYETQRLRPGPILFFRAEATQKTEEEFAGPCRDVCVEYLHRAMEFAINRPSLPGMITPTGPTLVLGGA